MKILISNMHNLNGGGHVTYIMTLAAGLKSNHDVTIAAPETSRLYEQACALEGVRVLPQRFTSRPGTLLREVAALRRFLKSERYDVIHVNGAADHRHMMLATLGISPRPALIWTKHNTNSISSFGNWLRARMGTDACIAVCNYVADILRASSYAQIPMSTIHLGVDVQAFSPVHEAEHGMARQNLFGSASDEMVVFGSVGGTDTEKGWIDLVVAVSQLDERLRGRVRIIVVGSLPSEEQIQLVKQTGISEQVLFPGLVTDVRPYLAACDVGYVLSYREAGSYASLETMATGLPTMVSDAGGLPENVRNGDSGWIVQAGNVKQIQEHVAEILNGKYALRQMGLRARQRVETEFSASRQLQQTIAVYSGALNRKRGSAPASI